MILTSSKLYGVFALCAAVALGACGGDANPPDSGEEGPAEPTDETPYVVLGVVSQAAPLTVGGTTFATASAAVRIDDVPSTLDALSRGMIVEVRAKNEDGVMKAVEIEVEHALRGEVSGRGDDSLFVDGHEVEIEHGTEFEDEGLHLEHIAEGERVRVSGFTVATGAIRATRIDRDHDAAEDFEIKGFVARLSPGTPTTFELEAAPGGALLYRVTLATGVELAADIQNGSLVEVRSLGTPHDGALTALAVKREDHFERHGHAEMEIEGIVVSGDASLFVIAGQRVRTDGSTLFENGTAGEVRPGLKLEAEGRLDDDGVLAARKVSFRNLVRLQGTASDVDATDARTGSFRLLGLTVVVDARTELDLGAGGLADLGANPVEVRGYAGRDALVVVATRIVERNDRRLVLQGPVTAKDAAAGTLVILGLTVQTGARTEYRDMNDSPLAATDFFAAIVPGTTVVKARGDDASSLSGGTLFARQVEFESSN